MNESYFKVTTAQMTRQQRIIYTFISANSDGERSNIGRKKLSELTGIKSIASISKITSELNEKKILIKDHIYSRKKGCLEFFELNPKNYIIVKRSLLKENLTKDELNLLIGLAVIRFNGTSKIHMSRKEIFKKVDFGRTKFFALFKSLKIKGLVQVDENDDIIISEKYFPVFSPKVVASKEEKKDFVKYISSVDTKATRMAIWTVKHNWSKIRNQKAFFDYVYAGVPFRSKNKIEKTGVKFNF